MRWSFWIFMIVYSLCDPVQPHDKVPPGISPQHYQQPPPPAHHGQGMHYQTHQPQMAQQHIPQQAVPQQVVPQQVNPQYQQQIPQMPQQVPQMQAVPQTQGQNVPHQQQQVPVQHHAHDNIQLLNTANLAHEKEHMAEHLHVPIDTNKMSDQELQFHYFKMHDADNNNKLDGCELIKSLIHWHEEGSKEPNGNVNEKIFLESELENLIDPILEADDKNKDGYIDYTEFMIAQQKTASATTHQ